MVMGPPPSRSPTRSARGRDHTAEEGFGDIHLAAVAPDR
jgi:hypothetical protein